MENQARILNLKPQLRPGDAFRSGAGPPAAGTVSLPAPLGRPSSLPFPTAARRRRHGLGLSVLPLPTPLPPARDVGSCLRQRLSIRSEGVKGSGGGVGDVEKENTRAHTPWEQEHLS